MPKMKWGDSEPDWDGMDDAEYSDDEGFAKYDGPIPPKNVILNGEIKKIWATTSQSGNAMFKLIWESSGNSGDKKKYDGLAIWDNVVLLPQTKFRWGPWLDALGLNLQTVRAKTVTAEDDDNVGTPVIRIGKVKFPVDVRIVTDSPDEYGGEKRARIANWLAPSDEEPEDDSDYEDEDEDDLPF